MIDREPIMRLSLPGPVKRSRATLESDPPRDNRTWWRRMSTRGSRFPLPHPTATTINIQSFPPCLINSGGVGAEPPRTVAERQCSLPGDSSLFAEGKIPFHAEPRQFNPSDWWLIRCSIPSSSDGRCDGIKATDQSLHEFRIGSGLEFLLALRVTKTSDRIERTRKRFFTISQQGRYGT